jgi:hypothetical protein
LGKKANTQTKWKLATGNIMKTIIKNVFIGIGLALTLRTSNALAIEGLAISVPLLFFTSEFKIYGCRDISFGAFNN